MDTKNHNFKIGDRVHISESRDSYEHDAIIVAIRDYAVRNIGVRFDDYESDIPWWYESSKISLLNDEKLKSEIEELIDIKKLAVRLVNQSYKDSHGNVYVDMDSFNELSKYLNMPISNIRPWQR